MKTSLENIDFQPSQQIPCINLDYQHSIHSKRTKLFPRCPVQCINAGFDPGGTSDILFCSIVSKRCLTNNQGLEDLLVRPTWVKLACMGPLVFRCTYPCRFQPPQTNVDRSMWSFVRQIFLLIVTFLVSGAFETFHKLIKYISTEV